MPKQDSAQRTQEGFFPVSVPSVFSQAERDKIIQYWSNNHRQGKLQETTTTTKLDQNIRRSKIARVDVQKEAWIMQRLLKVLDVANSFYQFDLTNGIVEPAQIAGYSEEDNGVYEWHLDIGPANLTRKLSVSIPLNDPSEYQGGEFVLNYGAPVEHKQEAGNAIVFPSYFLHKVSPVTKGVRYSLVTWVHGPKWR